MSFNSIVGILISLAVVRVCVRAGCVVFGSQRGDAIHKTLFVEKGVVLCTVKSRSVGR